MALQAQMMTIDCREPRKLADWWLRAFGGEVVTDYGEFVMAGSTAFP